MNAPIISSILTRKIYKDNDRNLRINSSKKLLDSSSTTIEIIMLRKNIERGKCHRTRSQSQIITTDPIYQGY